MGAEDQENSEHESFCIEFPYCAKGPRRMFAAGAGLKQAARGSTVRSSGDWVIDWPS